MFTSLGERQFCKSKDFGAVAGRKYRHHPSNVVLLTRLMPYAFCGKLDGHRFDVVARALIRTGGLGCRGDGGICGW